LPPGDWQYQPDTGDPSQGYNPNSRGGRWYQPGKPGDASWDSDPKGRGGKCGKPHWDVNDGKGNRTKVDEDGNPVSDDEAHPSGKDGTPMIQVPYYQPGYNPYAAFQPGFTPQETLTIGGLIIVVGAGGGALILAPK